MCRERHMFQIYYTQLFQMLQSSRNLTNVRNCSEAILEHVETIDNYTN